MRATATPEEDPAIVVTPAAPWRVAAVWPGEGYTLHVRFNDGTEGLVDLSHRLAAPHPGIFAALRPQTIFRQATVRLGAISWPPLNLDLPPRRHVRRD